MHFRDVETIGGSQELPGLELHLGDEISGTTRLEASPETRRVRLVCAHDPILWARVDPGYYGVWVLRRETHASPAIVPPIRASDVREQRTIRDWMRFFAHALAESARSPLRRGVWSLTELYERPDRAGISQQLVSMLSPTAPTRAYGASEVLKLPRIHFEEWSTNAPPRIFPLRSFSEPDAARVKAWRKYARAGTLPPVLMWFVGGIEMPLIIDGHDRLLAATCERVAPRFLLLCERMERALEIPPADREKFERAYERAFENSPPISDKSALALNEELALRWRNTFCEPRTTARARPDLDEEWCREVAAEIEGDEEAEHALLHER